MESLINVLIVCALTGLAWTAETHRIVTLKVGDNKDLDCLMPDNGIDDINDGVVIPSWSKYQDPDPSVRGARGLDLNNGVGLASNVPELMVDHISFTYDREGTNPPVNLKMSLTDVRLGETGRYVCVVKERSGTVRDTFVYNVQVLVEIDEVIIYAKLNAEEVGQKPNVSQWTHQQSVTLGTRNNAFLGCVARGGFPSPVLQVTIGGRTITGLMKIVEDYYTLEGTSEFEQVYVSTRLLATDMFPVALEEDGEQITCTATLEHRISETQTEPFQTLLASSTLELKAKPMFENCSSTAKTSLGSENFELRCMFLAKPAPTADSLKWTADSGEIVRRTDGSDGRYSASMIALDGDYRYEAILVIKVVEETDFQDYKLTVGNVEGESHFSIALLEGEASATQAANQQLSSIATMFVAMVIVAILF